MSSQVKEYASTEPDQILERVQGMDVVVTKEMPVCGDIIARFPDSVQLICEAGTGYNNIDIEAARARGIAVCNIPAYSTERVAHTAIMMILNLSSSMQIQQAMLARGDRSNFTKCMQVSHVEVNGKEVKPDEDGNITVKEGDEITVTVDKSKISDAQVFDQWVIKPDSVLNEVDPKSEKISFTMPAEDVTIEAMTRDASIEDDGPGILGTGALIATGVVGSAALLYQGHMLGTELYLRYLLPHGAVIPQNRAELAVLLWQDAENPEPVSTTLYSDISEDDSAIQQAARWAVENNLMEQLDADDHPDHFDPFVPVTFSDSIRAWKKAQELKK